MSRVRWGYVLEQAAYWAAGTVGVASVAYVFCFAWGLS